MVAGCADDSEPAVTPTLPPIATTASPSTAAPATTVVQPYEVREGDTLSAIAAAHGVSVDEVLAANPDVASADDIHAGQVLQIPVPATTTAPPSVSE